MSYQFHPTILRAYDIRGEVGSTLSAEDAYAIGRSFGQEIASRLRQKTEKKPLIAVGRDGRISSPELAAALMDGLCDAGADVIDIGVGATPMLYFADRLFDCDGAIQVTGSHNPKQFNGFKLVAGHASFFGDDIVGLADIAHSGWQPQQNKGEITLQDITATYVDRLAQEADTEGLRIVWDCGNGATGPAVEQLVQKLAGEHKTLYTEIDGTFPNHHPNPVDPETLDSLREEVAAFSADCGIGFDGDGDRIGLIDSKGRQIPGDILTAYLAMDILAHNSGAEIIFDVKSSRNLANFITQAGGKATMWKTGHSFIKNKMKESGALLAGEMSGHIFFKERWYGFDDGLYSAARMLEILAADNRAVSEIFNELPNDVSTPEITVHLDTDGAQHEFIDKFVQQSNFTDATLSTIDGVRADFDYGWGLVRASNTTPSLVIRFEAETEEKLNQLKADFKTQIHTVDPNINLPF